MGSEIERPPRPRLFVAIELPAELRTSLDARARRLAVDLPPGRFVRPEGLHVTLAFLGETAGDLLPPLDAALRAACAPQSAFELRLAGAGTFPPKRAGRVGWVGVEAPEELLSLHRAVGGAVEDAAGLPRDDRPFHAHVTLVRPREPWPRPACERFAAGLAGPLGESFRVDEIVLFESRLGPGGARYDARGRYPLAGEVPV